MGALRARFAALALFLLILAIVIPLTADSAHAQEQFESFFTMDLDEVSKLYQARYRDRLTDSVVDSLIAYDFETLQFGNQRARVPSFLATDFSSTREVVDYRLVPGYRATIRVPRTAFFERTTHETGELLLPTPRDVDNPDIFVTLTADSNVAKEVMVASRNDLWREYTRASVTAIPLVQGDSSAGGIKFEIPVPMPKTLESIFGPGDKTSITIRGREEITIAGETRVVNPYIGIEGRESQSLFPSLDMEQKLDVSLTGTIGDKVSIQVDHTSEQSIGTDANRVRLAYTGYEDEVIQLIELGNTNLSLPGSQLVSVSTNAQGLFGIKMLAKLGSTDITMIASKQEGEAAAASFSPTGGSLGQTETRTIRDVDYIKNKYFYVDIPQQGLFFGASEVNFEVYREVTPQDLVLDPEINRVPGVAVPDPSGTGQGLTSVVPLIVAGDYAALGDFARVGDFRLLALGIDYQFVVSVQDDKQIVGIELYEPIPNTAQKSVAIRYQNDGGEIGGSYSTYNIPSRGAAVDTLMLEMIKAPDPRPEGKFGATWDLAIRNIYSLGLTNIDGTSLDVTIEDILNPRLNNEVPDSATVAYLQIFGLDQEDQSGAPGADGRIDLTTGYVNLANGTIQFPSLRSFAPAATDVQTWTNGAFSFSDSMYAVQYQKSERIYDEYLNPTQEADVHQYIIKVSAVSSSKTFRINALDIVENSESVTLDGQKLVRNIDYDINYDTGEVTLKEGALSRLTPDSKVNIDYEYKPLGGIGSSTLAGVATISKLGENARIGTTFLYESKSTSAEKPRLGEEPTRAIVAGITASYQHQSRILTDVANWLPYVDTDAPSTLQLDGEIAASLPNPNTRNEAYIDDFEGIEDTDRIPTGRRSWYRASPPVGKPEGESDRHSFIWYNIEPDLGVHRRDLNPTLDEQENTLVQSLDIEMDANPALADSAKYTGLLLGFAGGGLDFSQGQFIQIWINDFKPDPLTRGGTLHIDMGVIDENFYNLDAAPGENPFDDEDKSRDGFAAALDDTGLDGLFNDAEGTPVPPLGNSEDPAGDDIDLRRINGRFLKANGTEANRIYDTEDLDRNGQLNRDNAYFSFTVDLADTAEIDIRELYPTYDGFSERGHSNDSWRLYRIKLTDYQIVSPFGITPRLDEIRHMRIWFDNAQDVVRTDGDGARRIQISEFQIVGNRWEADGIRDLTTAEALVDSTISDFAIGVISTKTDPGVYIPPINPNEVNEVADKESSLALRYSNLEEGSQIRILKRFTGAGLDMTLYRDLNFWVHTDQLRDGVEYYFRLATNDRSFYEIQIPFTSEYYNNTGWARVSISVADLTNLKFEPVMETVTGAARDLIDPSKVYRVLLRGTPNLTGVRFLYAGVRNRSNLAPQSGEIWIDDIYTGDVLRNFDHSERLTANLSVAGGAISVGGNWARAGADYRGLRQTRGSGTDQTVYGINARTDLQYFVPLAGFSLPVSGNWSRTRSLPKFPPQSDTEILDKSVQDSLRTERVNRGFTTSLSRRANSNNFLMRYTVDRLKPTFAYSDQRGISPAARDTVTNMTGSLGYQLTWQGDKTLPLFGKNRFRWWLNSIDLSTGATRQTVTRWSLRDGVFQKDPYRYSASIRNQGNVRYNPFRSLESSFGMVINRDAAIPHYWHGIDVGREVGRTNNMRLFFDVPTTWYLIKHLDPSFEVQSNYAEDSSPAARREGDPAGTRNVNAQRNDTARLKFDFSKHMTSLFTALGWDPVVPEMPSAQAPPDSSVPDSLRARPRPGAGTLFKGVGRMLTRFEPIIGNVQHRQSSNYSRIPLRPDLEYQLGFTTDTGLISRGIPLDTPDQKREDWSYNLNSGVRLMEKSDGQALDLQARYTASTSESDFRANQQRSLNKTWPDLQLKWDNLHEFAPLSPILADGELTVDYRKATTESGTRDEPPTIQTSNFTFTPGLLFLWKNELTSTLKVAISENSSETRGSRSTTSSLAVNLDLKKNFRAGGGINFFGKQMKWTNELESNLAISYTRNGGERFLPGSNIAEPIPSTTNIRVAPNVRYFFNRNINGSAFIDYSRSYAEALGQTITTLRLGVTALINF